MDTDPALYMAQRCRQLHGLSQSATRPELRRLALSRGLDFYHEVPRLPEPGCFVWDASERVRERAILVRPTASEHVHAHEVGEFLFRDNIAHGIDYDHPDFHLGDLHEASNRFADALCAPDLETPVPLWRVTRANSALPVRVRYCGRAGRWGE